jgi:uncharacterized membrane protein
MMKIITSKSLIVTVCIFGLIYILISLINHYFFRTYALDLGLYTNAIFKYAHLQLADSSMFKVVNEYLLGDHFDLYLVLFSPLVFLFGTYALLIVQIIAILAGGIGVHQYFQLKALPGKHIPVAATICFYAFFGVFSAVSHDYHSNVVAAMLIPWFFYFFYKRDYLVSAILIALVLIAKENMALWMLFICTGLAFEFRKDKKSLIYLSAYSAFSIVYFVIIIYFVMPGITVSGEYNGFAYSSLGQTPMEALKHLFLNPVESLKILFTNHTNQPNGDYVKLELHILVLLSGAYLLLIKPWYFVMLIPIYFQKMFHDNIQMWGVNDQYSIEFAPILIIGIFTGIAEFKNKKVELILAAIVFTGIIFSTIRVMDRTVVYTNKSKIRFYQASHYKRHYDVRPVHKQLNLLPARAKISALSPFVPHLALRNHIYQFPIVLDAEYIIYSEKEGKYPMDEEGFKLEMEKIMGSGEWEVHFKSEEVVVLKRSAVGSQQSAVSSQQSAVK